MEASLLDIHTHRLPTVPGTAIVNASPADFSPQPAMFYSLGLHPWHLDAADGDFDAMCRLIHHPQVVAVGEAGIDRLAGAPLLVQQAVFERQARLAEETGKPLVVHLVKAMAELLASHRRLRPQVPWIIHGFRGKAEMARDLLRHGLFLSFGRHYQPEALRAVPGGNLFIETDESLVSIDGLCGKAAGVRGTDETRLRETLSANVARTFLGQ